ncbi:MAG: glycosyltransferase family 2 protein [Candidatus Aureabacteria bacterium]|nr:glycosyltransferase family 2 protein [Candidatus Auribacterota bacterium]
MSPGKTLVLIPVFNESRSLGNLIGEIRSRYPALDVAVVDDGSRDDSAVIAREKGCLVFSHAFNLGDGAARQTGFLYALRGGYDYVVHLDGDRQHSPREIARLFEELRKEETDLVVGSRFLGACTYRLPRIRKIGMKIFSLICSSVIRQKITDPTSGFRGVNRRALKVFTSGYYPQHFPDADVIIYAHFQGLKIREIPVTMSASQSRSLHRGMTIVYYIYKMLLSSFVCSLRVRSSNAEAANGRAL